MSCMGVCAGWAGRGRGCVVGMREGARVCYCVQKIPLPHTRLSGCEGVNEGRGGRGCGGGAGLPAGVAFEAP